MRNTWHVENGNEIVSLIAMEMRRPVARLSPVH